MILNVIKNVFILNTIFSKAKTHWKYSEFFFI